MKTEGDTPPKKLFGILNTFCKIAATIKRLQFCAIICVIGYISSLPGICGREKIQRQPCRCGELIQFTLGP